MFLLRTALPCVWEQFLFRPRSDAAFHNAGSQPALHRRDTRQASGRAGRAEEGGGDGRARWEHEAPLDKTAGVVVGSLREGRG
jgi:hypothetical protein